MSLRIISLYFVPVRLRFLKISESFVESVLSVPFNRYVYQSDIPSGAEQGAIFSHSDGYFIVFYHDESFPLAFRSTDAPALGA